MFLASWCVVFSRTDQRRDECRWSVRDCPVRLGNSLVDGALSLPVRHSSFRMDHVNRDRPSKPGFRDSRLPRMSDAPPQHLRHPRTGACLDPGDVCPVRGFPAVQHGPEAQGPLARRLTRHRRGLWLGEKFLGHERVTQAQAAASSVLRPCSGAAGNLCSQVDTRSVWARFARRRFARR